MSRKTYVVRWGRLLIGTEYREAGQLVPEIETWFGAESFLGSGQCDEIEVSDGEFKKAVNEFCPELAERLGVTLFKGVKVPEPVEPEVVEHPLGSFENPLQPGEALPEPVIEPTPEPEPIPEILVTEEP